MSCRDLLIQKLKWRMEHVLWIFSYTYQGLSCVLVSFMTLFMAIFMAVYMVSSHDVRNLICYFLFTIFLPYLSYHYLSEIAMLIFLTWNNYSRINVIITFIIVFIFVYVYSRMNAVAMSKLT